MPDEYKAMVYGELISSKNQEAIEKLCNKVYHKTYVDYQCYMKY